VPGLDDGSDEKRHCGRLALRMESTVHRFGAFALICRVEAPELAPATEADRRDDVEMAPSDPLTR
jgi:hypothetical protein